MDDIGMIWTVAAIFAVLGGAIGLTAGFAIWGLPPLAIRVYDRDGAAEVVGSKPTGGLRCDTVDHVRSSAWMNAAAPTTRMTDGHVNWVCFGCGFLWRNCLL